MYIYTMTLLIKNVTISSSCKGDEIFTHHIIKYKDDILPIAIKFETFTIIGPSILDIVEYRYLLISNDINFDKIIKSNLFNNIKKIINNATANETICYLILYMKFKTIKLNYSKQYNQFINEIKDLDYSDLDSYKKYILSLSNTFIQLTKNDIVRYNDLDNNIWKLLYINKILINLSLKYKCLGNTYNLIIDWIYASGDTSYLFDDATKKSNIIAGGKIKNSVNNISNLYKSLMQTDVDTEILNKLLESSNLLTSKNYILPDLSILLFYNTPIEFYIKSNKISNINLIINQFFVNYYLLHMNDLILNISNLDIFYFNGDKFFIKDFSNIILGTKHHTISLDLLNYVKESINILISNKDDKINIQNLSIETLLVAYMLITILTFLSGLNKYYNKPNDIIIPIIKQIYKDIIHVLSTKQTCGLNYIENILTSYCNISSINEHIKYDNNIEYDIISSDKKIEIIDRSKYITKYIQQLI